MTPPDIAARLHDYAEAVEAARALTDLDVLVYRWMHVHGATLEESARVTAIPMRQREAIERRVEWILFELLQSARESVPAADTGRAA